MLGGHAPQPLTFTIDNPARIALDLPDTTRRAGLAPHRRQARAASTRSSPPKPNGRTRLVLNLDACVPYETRVEGNTIIVTLGGGAAALPAPAPRSPPRSRGHRHRRSARRFRLAQRSATSTSAAAPTAPAASWSSSPTPACRPASAGRRPHGRRFRQAPRCAENLMQRATTSSTSRRRSTRSTPCASATARASSSRRPATTSSSPTRPTTQYVIEIRPGREAAAELQDKKEYTGERLTLNFQDIETRAVLQLLADTSGQNIVVSDSVQGNVTLRLQNVPWDQALDIVLRTKGLDMRREGNVIYRGAGRRTRRAREGSSSRRARTLQELAPLRTEYLQVNYAKAADLAALIKSQGKSSLLSERGSVAIDERTNTLLLQDTSERLADIRRLVVDARHPGAPGADRSAHRHRQR